MKLLAFAASLRDDSYNRRLLDLAADELRGRGVEVDAPHFSEFDVPLYNQDLEDAEGIPDGATRLAEKLQRADVFVIATPEYNHSLPGVLKNLVDWASRIRPEQPFDGEPGLLMSASPSMVGGNRAAYHLRQPLMVLGARLLPDVFSLARAHDAFADDGTLADDNLADRLDATLDTFVDYADRLR